MTATLNTMTFLQVQAATAMSVGRSIRNADRLEMTDFGDCVRNDFWWNDGACFSMLHDTKDEASEQAHRGGFLAQPHNAN